MFCVCVGLFCMNVYVFLSMCLHMYVRTYMFIGLGVAVQNDNIPVIIFLLWINSH